MLGKIFDVLSGKKNLLDEARQEAVTMLMTDRRMFELVTRALKEEAKPHLRDRIMAMDKEVNHQQRSVRKKVFEHLTISRGQDLLEGLELTIAVIDLERIGDYGKNMSELVELLSDKMDMGEREGVLERVISLTTEMFDAGLTAFSKQDTSAANLVMEKYQRVSTLCDGTLAELVEKAQEKDVLPKNDVTLILMLRYIKRVAAHLKNLASAVVNPYHRIGFRA